MFIATTILSVGISVRSATDAFEIGTALLGIVVAGRLRVPVSRFSRALIDFMRNAGGDAVAF